MTSSTSVSLKIVVLVVTRKPLSRAVRIASTAMSQSPVVADVVVDLLHAVQVDDEREARVRLEAVEHVDEPERVRAELDVPLHLEEACDDLLDALEDQRLAAADGDDRRRALLGGVQALLDRQAGFVGLVLADLPQPMQAMLQPSVGSSMITSR